VPETRWLDEREQRTWRSFLTATRLLFDQVERQLQQGSQLPHAYFEILVHLSETPGRALRMSDLASTALSSRSRLSHAVARMEEAGWVRRRPCPSDRRGQLAELTDAGMAKLEAAAPGHVEEVRSLLFDGLSREQQDALLAITEAMVDHMSGGHPPWPMPDADPGPAAAVDGDPDAAQRSA
jgi:DNA-binding MarR family transcriptional regulator